MSVLTLYSVDILWLAQAGVCKTGGRDVLCMTQVGGCENVVSDVLWLEQVGGCEIVVCDVLWLAHVGGVRIGGCNSLLQGLCGLLQEIIEDGWICYFPGALSLPALYLFYFVLGEVPL